MRYIISYDFLVSKPTSQVLFGGVLSLFSIGGVTSFYNWVYTDNVPLSGTLLVLSPQ